MKKVILILLLLIAPASAQTIKINSILIVDKGVVFDIDPSICETTSVVEYQNLPIGHTISIESIICGDSIFSNGFD